MRILCVSDQVDPLVYSHRVKERYGDVDLVLAAGDLPMEYLGFISSMLNRPLLYVEGNHDLGRLAVSAQAYGRPEGHRLYAESFGAVDVGFTFVREEGLLILGLPGSMRYNRGPNQFTEFHMAFRLALLAPRLLWNRLVYGRAVDLVLTHAPPRGVHDRDDPCHRGFRCFRWLMRFAAPRWLVHGHVHLYDLADVRVSTAGATTVVNAFGHWIIETEEAP
ncbi:MAG: metallophosphoesterase [Spirochaetaceae bacterium]|nr:metallophosphoesterase [Spirochaetaceae bacterium]